MDALYEKAGVLLVRKLFLQRLLTERRSCRKYFAKEMTCQAVRVADAHHRCRARTNLE